MMKFGKWCVGAFIGCIRGGGQIEITLVGYTPVKRARIGSVELFGILLDQMCGLGASEKIQGGR